jgi:endonuclease YncB( thermonuclease family)/uncharacterized protein YraI
MLRRLLAMVFAVTFALPTASDALAQVVFPAHAVVHVATDLRTGPAMEFAVTGTAAPGQAVVLLAANAKGTWYRLDKGVWIDATSVAVQGSAAVDARDDAVPAGAQEARVKAIADGDTIIILLDGAPQALRYAGIDTPERGQPGYKAATEANRQLVYGKTVYVVADQSDRDRDGRLLRNVYLADGTFVNGQLVAQGMAQPIAYPPDTAEHDRLVQLAVAAARAQSGFWSGTAPYDGAMWYAITTAATPLYVAPGSANAVTGNLAADTPLTVLGRTKDNGWFQLRTPTRDVGWLVASAVAVHVPLAQIPITGNMTGAPDGTSEGAAPVPAALPASGAAAGTATVNVRANLRSGPGTNHAVVGAATPGMKVTVIGRNADGTWLQLATGEWIAAFLVD